MVAHTAALVGFTAFAPVEGPLVRFVPSTSAVVEAARAEVARGARRIVLGGWRGPQAAAVRGALGPDVAVATMQYEFHDRSAPSVVPVRPGEEPPLRVAYLHPDPTGLRTARRGELFVGVQVGADLEVVARDLAIEGYAHLQLHGTFGRRAAADALRGAVAARPTVAVGYASFDGTTDLP